MTPLPTSIEYSPKQLEFIQNATHRYNGKIGARQCGKTHIDVAHMIPERILQRKGLKGLNFILGVTKETIERNVLEPMRDFWEPICGKGIIGSINSRNIVSIFGEKAYCLGAEKVNQVSKMRGAKLKYLYIDEIVDINEGVFQILKSGMSLPYSTCDFTGNPSYPSHYVKKFIDSDADVYTQSWTIYDNPFLEPAVVANFEREYKGTIYFDRYIKGLWQRAEGAIYQQFCGDPKRFALQTELPRLMQVSVGLDFGGTSSAHAFVATGITYNYSQLIALRSERHDAHGTLPTDIDDMAVAFVGKILDRYGRCDYLEWDNESSVLGRGVKAAVNRAYPQVSVRPCYKGEIKDRIDLTIRLMGLDRFSYTADCETLKQALTDASWSAKEEDTRLDDGTSDVDSLDAFEYGFSRYMKYFIG